MAMRTVAGALGIAGVVAAIGLGLYAIGPPVDERARRLDERRVRALQALTRSIDEYWNVPRRLPESLAELKRDPRVASDTTDPVTGEEYEYRTVTERSYQLCAKFARQIGATAFEPPIWAHPAGRHCFDLEVHERGR